LVGVTGVRVSDDDDGDMDNDDDYVLELGQEFDEFEPEDCGSAMQRKDYDLAGGDMTVVECDPPKYDPDPQFRYLAPSTSTAADDSLPPDVDSPVVGDASAEVRHLPQSSNPKP